MIRKENVRYIVDKKNRVVKCILDDAHYLFIDFLHKAIGPSFKMSPKLFDKMVMKPYFWGVSHQSEEDEWNEDQGKLLAYHRMREKVNRSMRKRMKTFRKYIDKKLNFVEENFDNYMKKVDDNANRRLKIIQSFYGDKAE